MAASVASVGQSRSRDSREAGREAVEAAAAKLHGAPGLCIVFATAGYDQRLLIESVGASLGDVPTVGCSGAGIITQDGSDEGSRAVCVTLLGADADRFTVAAARHVSKDPVAAARTIAQGLSQGGTPRTAIVLPDGLTTDCSAFLRALDEAMPETQIVGGTSGELHRFDRTFQYFGREVLSDAVVACGFGGRREAEIGVAHGCMLLDIDHVVTRAEGATVFEIDGRPAWDVMRDYLDEDVTSLSAASVPFLCVGLPVDEQREQWVMRVPLGLDPATGALFFPGNIPQGAVVSMARRDPQNVADNARATTMDVGERRPEQRPALVLQFDCVGRGGLLFGSEATASLVDPAQRALGKDLPWAGFHSYGEIAPLHGATRFHNFSMALCALYERG